MRSKNQPPDVCDDRDNPGHVVELPWEVEVDANGVVWIGGNPIAEAKSVSIVGAEDGYRTLIFTVPSAEVRITRAGPLKADAGVPLDTVRPAPDFNPGQQVDISAEVRCRCNHSASRHRHIGGRHLTEKGSTACQGNGTGPCSCIQFIPKNLCTCGHTQQAHVSVSETQTNGDIRVHTPCRFPVESGKWCTCQQYFPTESLDDVTIRKQ